MKDAILELQRLVNILAENQNVFSEFKMERLFKDLINQCFTVRRRHQGIKARGDSCTNDVMDSLIEGKKSMSEIARQFNVSRQRIKQVQLRYGIPYERNKQRLPFDKMKELYDAGLNDAEIAREIGCSVVSVNVWRKREKLSSHYNYKDYKKPDPHWLLEAQEMLKYGIKVYTIAKGLGVNPSMVTYYLKRSEK